MLVQLLHIAVYHAVAAEPLEQQTGLYQLRPFNPVQTRVCVLLFILGFLYCICAYYCNMVRWAA